MTSRSMVTPLLPSGPEQDQRKPFSRCRCIWNPYSAIDAEKSKPFAQLCIVVDKAIGLTSVDFNGLADPYVTLSLNGSEDQVQRSLTQRQTLAPTWNQSFELDIHHPISILTVSVYDQEYGDSDLAEVFGLDDVLAGWVDIRIGALPLNEWTSGWFDLGDPKDYKDTLTGRIEARHPDVHAGVGRIHLKMILRTAHPHDELFAMCLPLPDLGHACHLDLADLVHDTVSLSKAMDKLNVDMWADIEWLLHHATPLYALVLLLIWKPDTFLPAMCILVPLGLIYISSHFSESPRTVPHGLGGGTRRKDQGFEQEDSKQPDLEVACGQQDGIDILKNGTSIFAVQHHGALSTSYLQSNQSLLCNESSCSDGQKTEFTVPANGNSARSEVVSKKEKMLQEAKHQAEAAAQRAQEAIDKADETEQTLKKLVNFMPKTAAKQLRKAAADMESIVQFVEMIEDLSAYRVGYGSRLLTVLALLCSIPVSLLVYWLAEYQKLLLQITFTVVVSINLWQFSFPGRVATGFYYYLSKHFRIRARSTHGKNDDHESVAVRVLAKSHIKHLHIKSQGKLRDDHIDLNGHRFDLTTFTKSTWCDDCGLFLWGYKEQGFYCKACERVVCKTCLHSETDGLECPGACQKHDFQLTTFHHATWCSNCDALLWGMHDQGYRCRVCCRVECHDCCKIDQPVLPV